MGSGSIGVLRILCLLCPQPWVPAGGPGTSFVCPDPRAAKPQPRFFVWGGRCDFLVTCCHCWKLVQPAAEQVRPHPDLRRDRHWGEHLCFPCDLLSLLEACNASRRTGTSSP